MIGIRTGVRGSRIGVAIGIDSDPFAPPPVVGGGGPSQDATSGKYVPASASEWASILASAGIASGNPSSVYLMQEASGDLADSIGGITAVSVATAPAYQQTVSGWARKALAFADASSTHFNIPTSPITESCLLLLYVAINNASPAQTRSIAEHPNVYAELMPSGVFRSNGQGNTLGTTPVGTAVHPIVLQSSIGRSVLQIYTDVEVLPGGFATFAGTTLAIGGAATTNTAAMSVLYGAVFRNAAADMTDAQVRSMLQQLGWAIAW